MGNPACSSINLASFFGGFDLFREPLRE